MKKNHLLIDIGSTHIKWAKVSHIYQIEDEGKRPFPEPCVDRDNFFEVDIHKIEKIIVEIIDSFQDIDKVFISAQMHGYILTDKKNDPITPYISWRDQRAKNNIKPFKIKESYGVLFKYNLPKVSIKFMVESNPELMSKCKNFYTLGSYITFKLTGKNETHITDAAPSGFYNVIDGTKDKLYFSLPDIHYDVSLVGFYKDIKILLF